MGDQKILEEELDPEYTPTEAEVFEYAEWLGIDRQAEKELLWIARHGLLAQLPAHWKPCQNETGQLYYFNFESGQSSWEHPCDTRTKHLVQKERARLHDAGNSGIAYSAHESASTRESECACSDIQTNGIVQNEGRSCGSQISATHTDIHSRSEVQSSYATPSGTANARLNREQALTALSAITSPQEVPDTACTAGSSGTINLEEQPSSLCLERHLSLPSHIDTRPTSISGKQREDEAPHAAEAHRRYAADLESLEDKYRQKLQDRKASLERAEDELLEADRHARVQLVERKKQHQAEMHALERASKLELNRRRSALEDENNAALARFKRQLQKEMADKMAAMQAEMQCQLSEGSATHPANKCAQEKRGMSEQQTVPGGSDPDDAAETRWAGVHARFQETQESKQPRHARHPAPPPSSNYTKQNLENLPPPDEDMGASLCIDGKVDAHIPSSLRTENTDSVLTRPENSSPAREADENHMLTITNIHQESELAQDKTQPEATELANPTLPNYGEIIKTPAHNFTRPEVAQDRRKVTKLPCNPFKAPFPEAPELLDTGNEHAMKKQASSFLKQQKRLIRRRQAAMHKAREEWQRNADILDDVYPDTERAELVCVLTQVHQTLEDQAKHLNQDAEQLAVMKERLASGSLPVPSSPVSSRYESTVRAAQHAKNVHTHSLPNPSTEQRVVSPDHGRSNSYMSHVDAENLLEHHAHWLRSLREKITKVSRPVGRTHGISSRNLGAGNCGALSTTPVSVRVGHDRELVIRVQSSIVNSP